MRRSASPSLPDYRKLVPAWAEAAANLPQGLWSLSAAPIGLKYALENLHNGSGRKIILTIEKALNVSLAAASSIFLSSQIAMSRTWIDQAFFFNESEEKILDFATKNIKLLSNNNIDYKFLFEKQSIFLISAFSSHYYGLLALALHSPKPVRLTIAQPQAALKHLVPSKFYERLAKALDIDIDLVEADSITSLIRSLRALKNGRHLALRVDSLPTEAFSFVGSSLLGAPSVYPLAILKLAYLGQAPLINAGVVRTKTKTTLCLTKPVQISSFDDDSLVKAVRALDAEQGSLIRSNPYHYSAWHGVYEKWRLAREIEALTSKQ